MARNFNPKWETFCRLYTQSGAYFGNATLSYAAANSINFAKLSREPSLVEVKDGMSLFPQKRAIGPSEYDKAYNKCSVLGHELLKKPRIQERLTDCLNDLLNDKVVDRELSKIILQDSEPNAKIAGIREYNKLRKRITDRMDITSLGEPVTEIKYVVPRT